MTDLERLDCVLLPEPLGRGCTMADVADTHRLRMLAAGMAGAGLLLSPLALAPAPAAEKGKKPGEEKEVGAVEDLMREHGVLRRALLVYIETVPKLRADLRGIDAAALAQTAKLFRSFGE